MEIRVSKDLEIPKLPSGALLLLYDLILEVDTEHGPDGYYHITLETACDALRGIDAVQHAHNLMEACRRLGLTELCIPHQCCNRLSSESSQDPRLTATIANWVRSS